MAAAWQRSISRKCARKIPKGNMGYDQYTVCNDCSCRTYFCSYPLHSQTYEDMSVCHLLWVPGIFLARFPVSVNSLWWSPLVASAYGRRCVSLRSTPKIPPYARKASGTQGMCHSFFFFWRTVHSKPPTITFVIVACTFFDNLSWTGYCIHAYDFISLQSCKIVRLLYLVQYAKRGVLRTNAKVKVLLLIATEQGKASKANETNEKRTRRSHFHRQKKN